MNKLKNILVICERKLILKIKSDKNWKTNLKDLNESEKLEQKKLKKYMRNVLLYFNMRRCNFHFLD